MVLQVCPIPARATRPKAPEIPDHVPPELVVDFDYLADPGFAEDPHAVYLRLRRGPAMVYSPRNGGHWIATRHDVIKAILHDWELFSSFPRIIPRSVSGAERQPFAEIDPPEHSRYRALLRETLSRGTVERFEQEASVLMRALIEEVQPRRRCDFVADIAGRFSASILMSWLGLPFGDRPLLTEMIDRLLRHPDPGLRRGARAELHDYVDRLVAERRRRPGSDFISQLAGATVADRPITHGEARAMIFNLIGGGIDTVSATMSFIAQHLADSDRHRRQLVANPERIPSAVDELLRWSGIANIARSVVKETEWRGFWLAKGDMVLLPLLLASRDSRVFSSGDEVDYSRSQRKHLSFGVGSHVCPGMHLARLELKVFLREWLLHIPEFRVSAGRTRARGGIVLGLESLPLEWG